jgi:hypothetical protein
MLGWVVLSVRGDPKATIRTVALRSSESQVAISRSKALAGRQTDRPRVVSAFHVADSMGFEVKSWQREHSSRVDGY